MPINASDKREHDVVFNTKHQHREWELVFMKSSNSSDGEEYHLEIVLRRRASFYAIVLIMPCIVLNLISLLMFFVDVKGTGRVDLALNLILSFFVLLIILVDSIPPSGDDVPLLGLYVTLSSALVVFMMLGSLFLIGLNKMKEAGRPVPAVLKCLTKKFQLSSEPAEALKVFVDGERNDLAKNNVSHEQLKPALSNNRNHLNDEMKVKEEDEDVDMEMKVQRLEAIKMDAVIFNLNILLFIVTILLHIALLVWVCIIWSINSE